MIWQLADKFRVVGQRDDKANDFMLFLLRDHNRVIDFDDDGGPNLYPFVEAQSAEFGRVFSATFPGHSFYYGEFSQDEKIVCNATSCNDPDGDGVSTNFENLTGVRTNPVQKDSDSDSIPDNLELFGNDGYSFCEAGHPLQRNLYVEVDYMSPAPAGFSERKPPADLNSSLMSLYGLNTSDDATARVFIDDAIPWHRVVAFSGPCVAGEDCIAFNTLKSLYFARTEPEKRQYFHYAVWGHRRESVSNGSGGVAELLGNDFLISLGAASDAQYTYTAQTATFVHELGHNVSLTHNGNDSQILDNPENSLIHESVMNYRYSFSGVPSSPGVPAGAPTYSHGPNNQCEPCATSPKAACVQCRSPFGPGCQQTACVNCDCDVDEWSSLNFNFIVDSDALDGPSYTNSAHRSSEGKAGESRWVDHVPVEAAAQRALRHQRVQQILEARGLRAGRDFLLTSDGAPYLECQ